MEKLDNRNPAVNQWDINETRDENRYVMPPEWAEHAATWACFPFNEDNWPGILKEVRKEYAELISTIAQFEPVHLFVNDDHDSIHVAQEYFHKNKNVHLHTVQMDDVWYRDIGPTFVKTKDNRILPIKWKFNGWGQKFPHEKDAKVAFNTFELLNCAHKEVDLVFEGGGIEVNGNGIALTTKQCLLNSNRNPNLTQNDIENYLKKYLGIQKCIWLKNGLENDHTDGHIDTIVRFAAENKILCSYAEDKNDPNHDIMEENLEILKRENTNNQFEIIMLPLPKNKMFFGEKRLACTYANFYMSNKFVIMPLYDDPNDNIALNILKSVFPNHQVLGLPSRHIITAGGSFHCLTQQQPAGELVPSLKVRNDKPEISSRGLTTGATRVALIQMSMTENLEQNLEKAFRFVKEAAQNGAQIILLPELFENLYFCQEKDEKYFKLANGFENHPFLSKFQALAKELNVVLPISFFEKNGPNYFNSMALINSDGKCLGIYRKTHIPDGPYYEEKFYFKPGDTGFKVWDTAYGKIGVGICWDQWFPECSRAMTLLGADLLLYPTAIGTEPDFIGIDTRLMWQKVMIGQAIANSVYVGAANRVGREKNMHFYGSSFVSDFTGEKISELNTSDEKILYANCNFKKAQEFRKWMGCLNDRKSEDY